MDQREGKQVHDLIDFVGLRAHATAVGLVQLTIELVQAGVIDQDAVTRVKDAIRKDLALKRPARMSVEEFETSTRRRLDRLFAGEESVSEGDLTSASADPHQL